MSPLIEGPRAVERHRMGRASWDRRQGSRGPSPLGEETTGRGQDQSAADGPAGLRGSGPMVQVRIHGRGGQGVVTAAEMLSVAAFLEGRHAQAFPSFGSERMGAPVVAFCRIADKEIRLREPIMEPDALIIQDPTLLHLVPVFSGLKKDGYVLINTAKSLDDLGIGEFLKDWKRDRICTVPANEISLRQVGRLAPNVPLL